MAETTIYQHAVSERSQLRASLKTMLEEMGRLHQENKQSQERIEHMDQDIDARLANIDAILARLAAS